MDMRPMTLQAGDHLGAGVVPQPDRVIGASGSQELTVKGKSELPAHRRVAGKTADDLATSQVPYPDSFAFTDGQPFAVRREHKRADAFGASFLPLAAHAHDHAHFHKLIARQPGTGRDGEAATFLAGG